MKLKFDVSAMAFKQRHFSQHGRDAVCCMREDWIKTVFVSVCGNLQHEI
jgi:hypothetical protein